MIAILLACVAVIFFFKSYYRESVSDDKLYSYVLGDYTLGSNAVTGQKVQSISDAIVSQYHQYFHQGGRVIVHFFVQMFSGAWGLGAFGVCNAFMALVAIASLIKLTQTDDNRKSIIIWTLIAISLLYLFPSPAGLFYSMAGSFNYLFPIVTSTIFFILLDKLKSGELSKIGVALFSIYAFVAGWTMEAFTLPISGGIFFWLIINRKKVNFSILPIVTFWLGTAMLVLAPGNFCRLQGAGSKILMFINAIAYFGQMKIFWLLIVAGIIYRIKDKVGFKEFCKQNQHYYLALAVAILFFFYVNTLAQSFTGIEFFSLILLLKILDRYFRGNKHNTLKCIISSACIILICVHQYYIIQDVRKIELQTQEIVSVVQKTNAAVMLKPEFHSSPLIAPFVSVWYNSPVVWWNEEVISTVYRNRKPFHILDKEDYDALMNPDKFFVPSNLVEGDAHAYEGEKYYWLKSSDITNVKEVEFQYYPISREDVNSLQRAFKYIIARGSYVSSQRFTIPDNPDELEIEKGVIRMPKVDRRVKSINIVH